MQRQCCYLDTVNIVLESGKREKGEGEGRTNAKISNNPIFVKLEEFGSVDASGVKHYDVEFSVCP